MILGCAILDFQGDKGEGVRQFDFRGKHRTYTVTLATAHYYPRLKKPMTPFLHHLPRWLPPKFTRLAIHRQVIKDEGWSFAPISLLPQFTDSAVSRFWQNIFFFIDAARILQSKNPSHATSPDFGQTANPLQTNMMRAVLQCKLPFSTFLVPRLWTFSPFQ